MICKPEITENTEIQTGVCMGQTIKHRAIHCSGQLEMFRNKRLWMSLRANEGGNWKLDSWWLLVSFYMNQGDTASTSVLLSMLAARPTALRQKNGQHFRAHFLGRGPTTYTELPITIFVFSLKRCVRYWMKASSMSKTKTKTNRREKLRRSINNTMIWKNNLQTLKYSV